MNIKARYWIMLILLASLLSSGATFAFSKQTSSTETTTTASDSKLDKLQTVVQTLQGEYYQKVDRDKLYNGAIDGMMKALDDPYSVYMDETEAKSFSETISASFVGIGAEIEEQDGKIVIVTPIKGSPAEKAGLRPNDRILKVGTISLDGMKATEAVSKIRGEKGTKAELEISRPGVSDVLHITVIRDKIPLETVSSGMKDDHTGFIQISQVSETTGEEFKKALKELKDKGMTDLVLDLRQNPGGLLNVAVDIADELIPNGKTILQVETRDGAKKVYKSKQSAKSNGNGLRIVALVDEGTASAGEILAGALQESAGVKLVGQKTFGKGTVQTTKSFDDGSNIKYTIAKWLTPDGGWIHKKGIKPDVEVKLPEYASATYIDPDKAFKPDAFANEVRSAQLLLTALGYPSGRTDGYFDSKTEKALKTFQKAQGYEATGILQGQTTRRLMELIRDHLKKQDPQMEAALKLLKEMDAQK